MGPGIALGLFLGLATACDVGGIDDAGTTDGGARPDAGEELDAGADAGLVDGGQHDSGIPVDVDGGADAGEPDPCALADPLAAVGTLAVGSGFSVVESATFGNGNALSSPMWIQEEGSTTSLYRIDDAGNIVNLGWFPTFSESTSSLGNVFAAGDVPTEQYLSTTVVTTGPFAVVGYTGFDAATSSFPGKVVVIDTTDFSLRFINAPGNFSYAAVDDTLFINGLGAGDLEGPGVYAVDLDTLAPTKVGAFGASDFAGSGFSFSTAAAVVGSGYSDTNFDNILFATSASALASASTPVEFSSLSEVFRGPSLGIQSHPDGFLNANGYYDASFQTIYTSLDVVEVSAASVAATPSPVVTFVDACTSLLHHQARSDGSVFLGIQVGQTGRFVLMQRD